MVAFFLFLKSIHFFHPRKSCIYKFFFCIFWFFILFVFMLISLRDSWVSVLEAKKFEVWLKLNLFFLELQFDELIEFAKVILLKNYSSSPPRKELSQNDDTSITSDSYCQMRPLYGFIRHGKYVQWVSRLGRADCLANPDPFSGLTVAHVAPFAHVCSICETSQPWVCRIGWTLPASSKGMCESVLRLLIHIFSEWKKWKLSFFSFWYFCLQTNSAIFVPEFGFLLETIFFCLNILA